MRTETLSIASWTQVGSPSIASTTSSSNRSAETDMPRSVRGAGVLRGRQPRRARRLEGVYRVGVAQGEPDVVGPFHQAPARELLHVEGLVQAGRPHGEAIEVDLDPRVRVVERRIHQRADRFLPQL